MPAVLPSLTKFPAFHGTKSSITLVSSAHHCTLFGARYTQFTHLRLLLLLFNFTLTLSSRPWLGLPSGLFPSRFLTKLFFRLPPVRSNKKQLNSMALVRERTIQTGRLSAKLVPTFEYLGCCVVSVTDPYGRILGLLDRSPYYFFQVALQFYSWGWVVPVPKALNLKKSGSAGNWTRTSGSVARNSDQQTHRVTLITNFILFD
jgi:hypothetical protein